MSGDPGIAAVLDATRDFTRRFVVMSGHQAVVFALWCFHTHAFDAADYTPYLWVKSAERESGKSRLKEIAELLVANPQTTTNISPPAVFRLAGEPPTPTLLVDELDEIFSAKSERSELRGLLNAGFRRGERATRVVGEGSKMKVRHFDVYCPKLLVGKSNAALGDTLESRCIPIELKRKLRDEFVERFRRRDVDAEALAIHESLRSLAEYHVDRLAVARPELPEELTDRQQDVCEPLFAIADVAGDDWPRMARAAAVSMIRGALVEDESIGVHLLADCQVAFGADDRLTSEALIERLSEDAEKPWGTWHHGNPISPRALAAKLKPYGIHSRDIRTSEGTRKGYYREQFDDVWNRYLPPNPSSIRDMGDIPHEYSDRTPLSIRDATPLVADGEEAARPHEQSSVADVADVADRGREREVGAVTQEEIDLGTAQLELLDHFREDDRGPPRGRGASPPEEVDPDEIERLAELSGRYQAEECARHENNRRLGLAEDE